ncbi:hypothetical protein SAMN05421594_4518 [Chryseobacterium oleae]|uniref:Uncharacterized protein n=1 Tax=Chryseobacterium oleae TaxID=491207 RepID=A0A1I5CGE3_CHROL|nr:hypothetical protein [Chryseobacterium oleae]SFN86079.1 hypothetical protein SAMN05421594_4518 [Chryseobacterium oleae]
MRVKLHNSNEYLAQIFQMEQIIFVVTGEQEKEKMVSFKFWLKPFVLGIHGKRAKARSY